MISSFVKSPGPNVSGLVSVEFIPVSSIATFPKEWEQEISDAITLVFGGSILKAYYTQGTGGFSCDEKKDPAGSKYDVSAAGFLPKELLENTRNFHKMSEDGFVVIAYDSNGYRRLAGTKEFPLKFTWSETSLAQLGGRQGYQWKFYREMESPAPFYTAP